MISPHTPPGTRVVCIDDSSYKYLPTLVKGRVYIVDSMEPTTYGDVGVCLVEMLSHHAKRYPEGWWLWKKEYQYSYVRDDFELAALPECLTSILQGAPLDSELEREPC